MSMTATQKIIALHCGHDVKAGDLVTCDLDLVLGNDITTPVAINEVKKANKNVSIPDKVVFVMDHFVPCKDIKSAEQCKTCREFAPSGWHSSALSSEVRCNGRDQGRTHQERYRHRPHQGRTGTQRAEDPRRQ